MPQCARTERAGRASARSARRIPAACDTRRRTCHDEDYSSNNALKQVIHTQILQWANIVIIDKQVQVVNARIGNPAVV